MQIPNFKEIIEGLKEILRLIYGENAPSWILPLTGYLLLGTLVLVGLFGLLTLLGKIKDLLTDKFWPLFYDKEKVRRSNRRRRFADHIESELRRLNNLEAWSDYRFTELEAEVDAEGRRRLFGIFPSFYRTTNTLRRERSLSKALGTSAERLIIVEGDPGSGKSVALRHVSSMLATRAMKSRSARSVIPIYVNLKEIERPKAEPIDRNLIASFVLKVLNRVNDRDIEEFLDEEFNRGLQDGTWFFLFDSFDEIPEILSSTEADKTVQQYATAISDFLHGLNQCRGIIASRFFHGPRQFGWPRFNILPLSSSRRSELVKRANLKPAVDLELLGQIETAGQEIRSMASNPMFLGLLCEHMRSGYGFPENTHSVFETYVSSRLNRDEERLYKRFQLEPDELRTTAEAVAFCMAADPGLGLSPTRKDIVASAQKLQIRLDDRFDRILDAITYLKLARTDTSTTTDKSNQFTFAHRRFQEYFSTAVVLREPHRVTPSQLLLDARWRETAVVLFQTQQANALSPLVGEASLLIKGFVEEIDRVTREQNVSDTPNEEATGLEKPGSSMRFQWPLNALHVMRLLQEGVARRLDVLPHEIRADVGFILTTASKLGITPDKKWALDVSGIAEASVLTELLRKAFSNPSQVLKDSAYKQVAKLSAIPVDLSYSIRYTLSRMALTGRLEKEKTATHAHLSRLNNAKDYLAALQLLIWLPRIDFALHAFVSVVILAHFLPHLSLPLTGTMGRLATTSIFIAAVGVPVSWYVFYRFFPRLTYTKFDPNSEIVSFNERERIASILPFMQIRTVVAILVLSIGGTIFGARKIFNPGSFYVLEQFWYPVWLYVTFWAPAALLFAISGRFLHPLLWWLLPFLSLGKIAKGLVMVIVLISRDTKGFLKLALLLILLYVAFLAVIFGGVRFIPYFALIFTFTLSIAALLTLSWWLYEKAHDILQWHQWNASKPTGINADDFIKTVRSYKTNKYRRRLTNAVRTKGLLIVSSDTEDLIYNFARELETRSSATSKRVGSVRKVIRYLGLGNEKADTPKEQPEEPSERNYIYGVAVSDEVVRLLEQVRVTR